MVNPFISVIIGRSMVLNRMKKGIINYSSVDRNIEGLRVLANTVIEMGLEKVYPKEGVSLAGQKVLRRYTNFWMLEGGKWMIEVRHANVVCN